MKFTPPSGFGFAVPNNGNDDLNSDVTNAYGINTTNKISMQPGTDVESVDAGLRLGALPVEWLSISAEWKVDFTEVRWSTASELNNHVFEIERRHESEAEFIYIGELDAAGNSTTVQDYRFEDHKIDRGGKYFIRVKQVDLDGQYAYSAIVFANAMKDEASISLYPNPSIGMSTLSIDLDEGKDVSISFLMQVEG